MPQIAALGEPRTVQYTIRMTAAERARFHEVARRRGMTLTELMRGLLAAEAEAEAAQGPATDGTIGTGEVAKLTGRNLKALCTWAERNGIGAHRDGFRVVGRCGVFWRWAPVAQEVAAT